MKLSLIILGAALLATTEIKAQQMSLSQEQCRQMAIEHSEDLQKSHNSLKQSELDKKIATTAFLPRLEGSAMGVYMFPDLEVMGSQMSMRGTYMAGINLTQPLYAGGKITTGKKLADIGYKASDQQYRMAKMDVLADADNAYWTYVAVLNKIKMIEDLCTQMDTIFSQTMTAVDAGMATDNDLLRIKAKRSEIEYQMQKVKNGADLCRMALCNVIGVDLNTTIAISDTVIQINRPESLSEDINMRPELQLLKYQVSAKEQQVKMTRSDFLPSVGFSLGYTYYGNIKMNSVIQLGDGMVIPYSQEFKDGIGLAMIAVKIPISIWGDAGKKVRKAKLDLRNAQLDMQKNTRLMTIEVRQAIQNITDGYKMVEVANLACQQANENLRVMQNKYNASMASLTDLLDAQSQWQQSHSNLIEAQTQYKIYETEYLRATGQLQ